MLKKKPEVRNYGTIKSWFDVIPFSSSVLTSILHRKYLHVVGAASGAKDKKV
jgi:hypothetical protein